MNYTKYKCCCIIVGTIFLIFCSDEALSSAGNHDVPPSPLTFTTRVAPMGGTTHQNPKDESFEIGAFKLYAFADGSTTWMDETMDHSTDVWQTSPIAENHYLPSCDTMAFYGLYQAGGETGASMICDEEDRIGASRARPYLKYTVPTDLTPSRDLYVARHEYSVKSGMGGHVELTFHHALSRVVVKAQAAEGATYAVRKVALINLFNSGYFCLDHRIPEDDAHAIGEDVVWQTNSESARVNYEKDYSKSPILVSADMLTDLVGEDAPFIIMPQRTRLGRNQTKDVFDTSDGAFYLYVQVDLTPNSNPTLKDYYIRVLQAGTSDTAISFAPGHQYMLSLNISAQRAHLQNYMITLNPNGGLWRNDTYKSASTASTGSSPSYRELSVRETDRITIPDENMITKAGHKLLCWTAIIDGNERTIPKGDLYRPAGNMILTAVWEKEAIFKRPDASSAEGQRLLDAIDDANALLAKVMNNMMIVVGNPVDNLSDAEIIRMQIVHLQQLLKGTSFTTQIDIGYGHYQNAEIAKYHQTAICEATAELQTLYDNYPKEQPVYFKRLEFRYIEPSTRNGQKPVQKAVIATTGNYDIECYGGAGGHTYTSMGYTAMGGKGGHVKGRYHFNTRSAFVELAVRVGGMGKGISDYNPVENMYTDVGIRNTYLAGGFNGGGDGGIGKMPGSSGGGATDLRLWDEKDKPLTGKPLGHRGENLQHVAADPRIIVAGGGGGAAQVGRPSSYSLGYRGGNGGGEIGGEGWFFAINKATGEQAIMPGGTQTGGGKMPNGTYTACPEWASVSGYSEWTMPNTILYNSGMPGKGGNAVRLYDAYATGCAGGGGGWWGGAAASSQGSGTYQASGAGGSSYNGGTATHPLISHTGVNEQRQDNVWDHGNCIIEWIE